MHNPLTREFAIKLQKLNDFAALVEDTFVARAEALDAELTKKGEKFPETERFELFEYYAEDYFDLSEELPTILRYSVLTAADTAFEVYLNNTAETYAEIHKHPVRLNDFKNRGIERARQYLKKVTSMPFPDQDPTWTTVVRLHELRNSSMLTESCPIQNLTSGNGPRHLRDSQSQVMGGFRSAANLRRRP